MAIDSIIPPNMDSMNMEFMSSLRDLLVNEKFSENRSFPDLTVVCGTKSFAAHRSLLSARSAFFDGAARNPFRESRTGIVDLSQDDPEAVQYMIEYLYNLDYMRPVSRRRSRSLTLESLTSASTITDSGRPMSPVTPTSETSLGFNFINTRRKKLNLSMVEDPLLAMAAENVPKALQSPFMTRFGLTSPLTSYDCLALPVKQPILPPPIDTFIPEELESPFSVNDEESVSDQQPDLHQPHLVTHAKVYAIAEQYGIRGLKTLAKSRFSSHLAFHRESPELPEAIREVYESTVDTDRGLRDVVINLFRQFPELGQDKAIDAVARETPSLGWELYRMSIELPV